MSSVIPPTGKQLISMIKATSLVSMIAMGDLLYSVQAVYNRTFEIIPMLMVAVIWYLLITFILNLGQSAIERYYARGTKPHPGGQINSRVTTDNAVLKGIDLDVFPGEVVVILGSSSSGKSTFLRCINHLKDMNAGSITVGDDYPLSVHDSAAKHCRSTDWHRFPRHEALQYARKLLATVVGLSDKADA